MTQDFKKNKNIHLGKVDLDFTASEAIGSRDAKVRITAMIDGDIYEKLKERASNGEGGGKYQTLLNKLLRDVVFSETRLSEFEVVRLKQIVESFEEKQIKRKAK
jgi:uncharacterized protein (DUF4415 family)